MSGLNIHIVKWKLNNLAGKENIEEKRLETRRVPEDNAVQVEWILNDAGRWNTDSEDVLKIGQVILLCDPLQTIQITVGHNQR